MPKQRRRAKPNKGKNQDTAQEKAKKAGVTWGGDPTTEIRQRKNKPKKKTGRMSPPTENIFHTTKIRFGAFHPQEHFSKAVLALIPVDEDF